MGISMESADRSRMNDVFYCCIWIKTEKTLATIFVADHLDALKKI
jgi:hypothetical protein